MLGLILALSFSLIWSEPTPIVDGFRLYAIDTNGVAVQLGADIPGDARTVALDEPTGRYVLGISAFNANGESALSSPLLTLRVKGGQVREVLPPK
jgi:hypothetical protein